MGIFRRKAKAAHRAGSTVEQTPDEATSQDEQTPEDTGPDESATTAADTDEATSQDPSEGEEAAGDVEDTEAQDDADEAEERLPRPYPVDRTDGPFDKSEVESLEDRMNFGALAIAPIEGMELRLDVDEKTQQVTGLTAVVGQSACQMQAFAAPKSRGVWDGIRDDIADGLHSGGGTATEQLGPLGIELQVRMPGRGADGRTTYSPARFIGVDGPRWFLRAVLSGAAATDEDAAAPLLEYVRRTVVVRGGEARAPRELLPLSVPEELVATPQETVENEEDGPNAADLKPFERGPEITEVR